MMKHTILALAAAGMTCGLAVAQQGNPTHPGIGGDLPTVDGQPTVTGCFPVPEGTYFEKARAINIPQLIIDNGPKSGIRDQRLPRGLFVGPQGSDSIYSTFSLTVGVPEHPNPPGTYLIAVGTQQFEGPGLAFVDPASGLVSLMVLRWGSIPRDSFGNLNTHFYRVGFHNGQETVDWDMPIPNNLSLVGQSWVAQAGVYMAYPSVGLEWNLLSSACGGEIALLLCQ